MCAASRSTTTPGASSAIAAGPTTSVLPYFKKSEHYEMDCDDSRGKGGLLNVADMSETHLLCDAFIDAAEASGFPKNKDYNNGTQEGFGYYQVTMKNGKRWSTARAFLDPARSRPNLRSRPTPW